jgi:hypothetical protein
VADIKKKDWCTDKDPWRWERCGDCGAIIGKDYGSFSHMCDKKAKRIAKIKKREREQTAKFKEDLKEAKSWPFLFVDEDGAKRTLDVPIIEKHYDRFATPYHIRYNGRIYRSWSDRYWTATSVMLDRMRYAEISPEVELYDESPIC